MAAWSDGALPPMCEPSAAMACSTRRPVTGGLVTMPSSFSRSSQPALRAMSSSVAPARALGVPCEKARPTGPAASSRPTSTSAGSGTRPQSCCRRAMA